MKKYLIIILLLLLFSCAEDFDEKPTFADVISNYPHDNTKLNLYEEIYNETNNIIYAVNKVNYPNFLLPNTSIEKAFTINKIIFVNTNYSLDEDFVPKNLIKVTDVDFIKRTNQTMYLDKDAFNAYKMLYLDALKENIHLTVFSSYRSFAYQKILYDQSTSGFVARPGTSEHQTGLSIDISTRDLGLTNYFNDSLEANFLKNNAHKYGFILRYPKDKEHITGYPYESWHYRYVGNDVAKFIYENNLTLEEYLYYYLVL